MLYALVAVFVGVAEGPLLNPHVTWHATQIACEAAMPGQRDRLEALGVTVTDMVCSAARISALPSVPAPMIPGPNLNRGGQR